MHPRRMSKSRGHERVQYGRLVAAFLRAGWKPPRPSDRIAHAIIDDMARVHSRATLFLSPMQLSILERLAEGDSYAEIQERLGISHESFRSRQKDLYRRLGVSNAAGAVGEGFRLGILS